MLDLPYISNLKLNAYYFIHPTEALYSDKLM